MLAAGIPPSAVRQSQVAHALRAKTLTVAVADAVFSIENIDVDRLTLDTASDLAAELDEPVAGLQRLRSQLIKRSRAG